MATKDPSTGGPENSPKGTLADARLAENASKLKNVPRGIELLLKKACVDGQFRTLLLEERSGAARSIALELDPAEAAMLNAIPREHLGMMIRQTSVRPEDRRAFLGKVASVMLAALAVEAAGCKERQQEDPGRRSRGHAADRVPRRNPGTGTGNPLEEAGSEDREFLG